MGLVDRGQLVHGRPRLAVRQLPLVGQLESASGQPGQRPVTDSRAERTRNILHRGQRYAQGQQASDKHHEASDKHREASDTHRGASDKQHEASDKPAISNTRPAISSKRPAISQR